jgi:hypothetical protein
MRIGRGDPNKTRNKGIYEDPRLNSSPTTIHLKLALVVNDYG